MGSRPCPTGSAADALIRGNYISSSYSDVLIDVDHPVRKSGEFGALCCYNVYFTENP